MVADAPARTCSCHLDGDRRDAHASLMYHGKKRILEPHDHGILNGSVQLLGYQVAGKSSRRLTNWLRMKTDEIINLEMMDQTFPGGPPTATGNHTTWDKLFIQ